MTNQLLKNQILKGGCHKQTDACLEISFCYRVDFEWGDGSMKNQTYQLVFRVVFIIAEL